MEPIRVLIVDDEVEFLETLVKRLRKRNLTVDGVTSGEAALELLKASPVDVVVLDVKMPGMSGLDTLREIRKGHNHVEVIMLTGHASVEAALEGMVRALAARTICGKDVVIYRRTDGAVAAAGSLS